MDRNGGVGIADLQRLMRPETYDSEAPVPVDDIVAEIAQAASSDTAAEIVQAASSDTAAEITQAASGETSAEVASSAASASVTESEPGKRVIEVVVERSSRSSFRVACNHT